VANGAKPRELSRLLHHYQHEAHHDSRQRNHPANPVRTILFCLPDGVHGPFLFHDPPAFRSITSMSEAHASLRAPF